MKAALKKLINQWQDMHFQLQTEANLLSQQGMALESYSRKQQANLLEDRIREAEELFGRPRKQTAWVPEEE